MNIIFLSGVIMKKLLLAGAAIASLFATGAFAADLPARVYTKAPVVPPAIYSWTGFYIGGNVGYGWGRENDNGTFTGTSSAQVVSAVSGLPVGLPVVTTLPTLPIFGRSNVNGVIGGGQAGYNWQFQNWLIGLEGDFQGSDEHSTGALCTAYACNAPVLALTGQIPQATIGRGLGMLHELPDQLGVMERLAKYAARIRAPHDAPHIMNEAFRHLRSGRPRPVALEVPPDVWPKRAAMDFPPSFCQSAVKLRPDGARAPLHATPPNRQMAAVRRVRISHPISWRPRRSL